MLEILKTLGGELKTLNEPEKGCWINVVSPTEEEMSRLNSIIDLPYDIFISVKDRDEVPTIEKFGNTTFILIRIPEKITSNGKTEYATAPLGIITTKDFIITLCYCDTDLLSRLKEKKKISTLKKRNMGLKIMLSTAEDYLKYLREINKKIYSIRNELEVTLKNRELMKLLDLEKSLVFFNTSLKSNKNLIVKLNKENIFAGEHMNLIEDVIEEIDQAGKMTQIYTEIINGMMSGFSSVISNNLNMVMKFLTSVTIILMIPTLVSSIYGMNVELPLGSDPNAFIILIVGSLILSIIGAIVFWRKELF